jgi:hypothetical protein
VTEGVYRILAAPQRYCQAATASGRKTIAANEQARQQQAARPAGQEAHAAITHSNVPVVGIIVVG